MITGLPDTAICSEFTKLHLSPVAMMNIPLFHTETEWHGIPTQPGYSPRILNEGTCWQHTEKPPPTLTFEIELC